MPSAGSSYYGEFVTSNPTTGAAQTADSLPVATANHNGADDATFALTVTLLDTGRYSVTGFVPSGYAEGDAVQVSVAATVASVAGKGITDRFAVAAPTGPVAIGFFKFFMALSTDGRSPALGKTVTGQKVADNGSFITLDNSATINEVGDGNYWINLTVNDLTYNSNLLLIFSAPGCETTEFTLI